MESKIFGIKHVFINIEVNTQKEAFELIAQKYVELGYASNYKKTLKGLYKREKEGSTGFTDGIAIPHAKIKEIGKPGVFVFQFKNGVDWNSIDGSLVKIAIALAIPAKNQEHLKILSSIARKLIDDDFRNSLKMAQTVTDLYNLINQVEMENLVVF